MKRAVLVVLLIALLSSVLLVAQRAFRRLTTVYGVPVKGQQLNLISDLEGVWLPYNSPDELVEIWIYQEEGKWRVHGTVQRSTNLPSHGEILGEDESMFDAPLRPVGADPKTGKFTQALATFTNTLGPKNLRFKVINGHLVIELEKYITEENSTSKAPPIQYMERMTDPKDLKLWLDVNRLWKTKDLQSVAVIQPILNDLLDQIGTTKDIDQAQDRVEESIDCVFPNREAANYIDMMPFKPCKNGFVEAFKIHVSSSNSRGDQHFGFQYLWFTIENSKWKVYALKFPPKLMSERNVDHVLDIIAPGDIKKMIVTPRYIYMTIRDECTNFAGAGFMVFKKVGNEWKMTQHYLSEIESWVVNFGKKNGKDDYHSVSIETNGYLRYLPGCHGSPDSHWREDFVWKGDKYVKVREVYLPHAVSTADDMIGWAVHKQPKKVRQHCATDALYRRFMKLIHDHPLGRDGYYDYEEDHMAQDEDDPYIAPKGWGVYLCMGKVKGKWMLTGIKPLD